MTVPTRRALRVRPAARHVRRPLVDSARWTALRTAAAALGLALGLGGCADGAAPTAPSPSVRASETPVAARGGTELPFRGTLDAQETGQFQPVTRTVLVRLLGTGTASHLGRYTAVSEFTLSPATLTAAGRVTFTAANGDVLTATFTGRSVVTGGTVAIVESLTITGGTGRFAGATGDATLRRTLTRATGISVGSFEGTLDLKRGK